MWLNYVSLLRRRPTITVIACARCGVRQTAWWDPCDVDWATHCFLLRYGSESLTIITILKIFCCWHILTEKHLFSFCDCFVSKTLPNVHNLPIIGGAAQYCELRLISALPSSSVVVLFTCCQFQNPKALLWVKVGSSNLESPYVCKMHRFANLHELWTTLLILT